MNSCIHTFPYCQLKEATWPMVNRPQKNSKNNATQNQTNSKINKAYSALKNRSKTTFHIIDIRCCIYIFKKRNCICYIMIAFILLYTVIFCCCLFVGCCCLINASALLLKWTTSCIRIDYFMNTLQYGLQIMCVWWWWPM